MKGKRRASRRAATRGADAAHAFFYARGGAPAACHFLADATPAYVYDCYESAGAPARDSARCYRLLSWRRRVSAFRPLDAAGLHLDMRAPTPSILRWSPPDAYAWPPISKLLAQRMPRCYSTPHQRIVSSALSALYAGDYHWSWRRAKMALFAR